MSISDEFLIEADVSQEALSKFLAGTCNLRAVEQDSHGTTAYCCDDFSVYLSEASELSRDIIHEAFGFVPTWELSFCLHNVPFHDSHPRLAETIQLLILEYDSNCVWLTNGDFPQLLKHAGTVTIQGAHSSYSHWADFLRRIATEIGLPFQVKPMSVI